MEELHDRLIAAYNTLRANGKVHSQHDFALLLDASDTTVSRAFNKDPRYLTRNIVKRAESIVDGKVPQKAERTPQPEAKGVFIPAETMDLYTNLSESVRILSETVSRMQLAGGKKNGDTIPASPTLNTKFYE